MNIPSLIKPLAVALAACCLLPGPVSAGAAKKAAKKAAEKWVEQKNVELLGERKADGDSFGMTVASPTGKRLKRTYRLYGVDCAESDEKDKVLEKRIQDQAAWFGREPEEIPRLGKEAARFTEKLLKDGKPRVLTRGKMGSEVEKAPGRPQRYYALVEVTGPDGKRHWLHELLLEAGHARAFGVAAPWPADEEDRHGEAKAKAEFKRHLETLEHQAKRQKKGIWAGPVKP